MKKSALFILFISCLFLNNSLAQEILTFDFSILNVGNEDTAPSNYNDPHLNSSTMLHGPGVSALDEEWLVLSGATYDRGLFNSYNWTTNSSVDLDDYIEFTITPKSGYQFSIRSISIQHESQTPHGPIKFVLRTSKDFFTEDIGGVNTIPIVNNRPIITTIEFDEMIDVNTPLTIRLYAYDANIPYFTWGVGYGFRTSGFPVPDNHIIVNGFVITENSPSIFNSKTDLSYFSYYIGSGPSDSYSFNVIGTNLIGNLNVDAAGTNYEISEDGTNFGNSINLLSSGGNVLSTTIHVRLKSGLTVNNYNEHITISGGGADVREVNLNGYVSPYELVINEIFSDGDGDANNDGITGTYNSAKQDQFIELVNIGTSPIDLTNFKIITPGPPIKFRHEFLPVSLPAGDGIVVFGGGDLSNFTSSLAQVSSKGGLYLRDAGDTIRVWDNSYRDVAVCSFGPEAAENQSIARNPDYTGPFVKHTDIGTNNSMFSPGRSNTTNEPLPVELSSFSAIVLQKGVRLEWRTETEVKNYGFDVQRNESITQSSGWSKIGFVEGNGNSNSPKEYYFLDEHISSAKYYYRLKQIDTDGKFSYSNAIEVQLDIPTKFELAQNFPNPFNPSTTIQYSLPKSGLVNLSIFNLLGEKVKELVNEQKEPGTYTVNFNASNLNSGLYFYKIETDGFIQTRKMMLLK